MTEDIKREVDLWSERNKQQWILQTGEIIQELWNKIGYIKVKCPYCGHVMSVQTVKSKSCLLCRKSFQIYPKNDVSRVIWCPSGGESILFNIHSLEETGQFVNIL